MVDRFGSTMENSGACIRTSPGSSGRGNSVRIRRKWIYSGRMLRLLWTSSRRRFPSSRSLDTTMRRKSLIHRSPMPTESHCNACVPLPQPLHTGAITATNDRSAGKHTYPTPNDDTVFFCMSDFHPFVYDKESNTTVNVVPVAPRGSGDGRVRVVGVHSPDLAHPLAKRLAKKHIEDR